MAKQLRVHLCLLVFSVFGEGEGEREGKGGKGGEGVVVETII